MHKQRQKVKRNVIIKQKVNYKRAHMQGQIGLKGYSIMKEEGRLQRETDKNELGSGTDKDTRIDA